MGSQHRGSPRHTMLDEFLKYRLEKDEEIVEDDDEDEEDEDDDEEEEEEEVTT